MAKSTLYFIEYNNYINRRVEIESSLAAYISNPSYVAADVNFNIADGIMTTQTVNSPDDAIYNYMVEAQGGELKSRWFVIEKLKTRLGQYRVTLKRDVLADYDTNIRSAIMYFRRGRVSRDNPLLFNPEGFNFNQIKVKEQTIEDHTHTPWMAIYLASNFFGDTATDKSITVTPQKAYSVSYATLEELLAAYPGSGTTVGDAVNTDFRPGIISFYASGPTIRSPGRRWTINAQGGVYWIETSPEGSTYRITNNTAAETWYNANYNELSSLRAAYLKDTSGAIPGQLESANGIIARVGSAENYKYYQLKYTYSARDQINLTTSSYDDYDYTRTAVNNFLAKGITEGFASGTPNNEYTIGGWVDKATAQWIDVSDNVSLTLKATAPALSDAPYYMLMVPYQTVKYKTSAADVGKWTNEALTLPLLQAMVKAWGSYILDAQLLPYFPNPTLNKADRLVDFSDVTPDSIFVSDNGELIAYFAPVSTFSNEIEDLIPLESDPKVQNETQFVRLNSPNYASSYDFSAAKNGGVNYWEINCSYKPYQPYIHISPRWGGVYGKDFGDARGLVCAGDFSLPIVSSVWTEYQINNKNYQLMFDRQIESMDYYQGFRRIQQIAGAVPGAISGAMSGAAAGATVGGPYGAIAGGVGGGVASAVGGAVDIGISESIYRRQREDSLRAHEYTLGNIKARPNSLTKIGALNANNRLYPFYEIYEATEAEKNALIEYLFRYSYSIEAIGTLNEFCEPNEDNFVRAEIINIDFADDSHAAEDIDRELRRGVIYPNFQYGGTA